MAWITFFVHESNRSFNIYKDVCIVKMSNHVKAVGLFSGGLDSLLAAKLMIIQDIDIRLITFVTPFCPSPWATQKKTSLMHKDLGVKIKIVTLGKNYIKMVKNPKFGYGKNMNPCIDCRVHMIKKAKEYMEKIQAKFIFTGEVLGQRPMTQQKKNLGMIEKKTGLQGLIVRPLSAKNLEMTIPEKKGWIDREKLLDLSGRGRKEQILLAQKLGITSFPWPAGGCLLTDPQFTQRIKDAFNHGEDTQRDLIRLRYGRHFRLENGVKAIVGRNEQENAILTDLADEKDSLIEIIGCGSPRTLLQGKDKKDIAVAAAICARYSDCTKNSVQAHVWTGATPKRTITIHPLPDQEIKKYMI